MRVPDHAQPIRVRWYKLTPAPTGVSVDFDEYPSSDWDDDSTNQNPALGEQGAERNPWVDWRECVQPPYPQLPLLYGATGFTGFLNQMPDGFVDLDFDTGFIARVLFRDAYPEWSSSRGVMFSPNEVFWYDSMGTYTGSTFASRKCRPTGRGVDFTFSFPSLDGSQTYTLVYTGLENVGVIFGTLGYNARKSNPPPVILPPAWETAVVTVNDYGT